MQKMSREMRQFLAKIIALSLVVGVWTGNNKLMARFNQLPVDVTPAPTAQADEQKSRALASLYPLVAAADGRQPGPAITPAKLDAAFIAPAETKKKERKVKPPPPPDYFLLLANVLTVDAISNNGAILSGHFYAVNEPISDYAFPGKVGFETPVISGLMPAGVVIAAGNRHLTLQLHN